MRRVAVLAVMVVGATVGVVAHAATAGSPKARLMAMQAAVASRHSVHYVTVSSGTGHAERMVCDVGPGRGIQRITFTDHGRSGPATVIVVNRSAYIRGTTFTLHAYFGFTEAQASRYGNRWIAIPHTSPGFATVSADVTYASFRAFLFPKQKLELVSTGKLVGVRGTAREEGANVLQTVYAPARGTPLPTEARAAFPGHPGSSLMTMTRWNEAVRVTAPANAVPVSTVAG